MHLPHLTAVATTATFSFGPSSCARIRVQCMRLLLQLIQPMCCCSSSYSAYACYKPRPHRPAGPLHTAASRPCPAAPARPVVALTVHVVHIAQLFLCMHLLVHMGYILLADLVRSVQRILLASPVCTRATTAANHLYPANPPSCSADAVQAYASIVKKQNRPQPSSPLLARPHPPLARPVTLLTRPSHPLKMCIVVYCVCQVIVGHK